MENKELNDRIRQKKFFRNNGTVLKGINLLRTQFVSLPDLKYALEPNLTEPEFLDSVNYLTEGGYIRTRHIRSKQEIALADAAPEELEAKVTQKGIQIIACILKDDCIEV
ncbi:MAG: type VI secretion protein [Oscillospiraceae bacterium]|nr:type VI secretion protein [Oscillospiraceae bacterium]